MLFYDSKFPGSTLRSVIVMVSDEFCMFFLYLNRVPLRSSDPPYSLEQ